MASRYIFRSDPAEDYKFDELLGRGGFGEVIKAKRIKDGLLAAVKIVKCQHAPDGLKILQEIATMQVCRHYNIVAYFEAYFWRNQLYICMEYCGGRSLKDIYSKTGSLSELQVAYVCREALKGLQYLHYPPTIVHRDVKGANILLTDDGDVKLADFGVSALITDTMSKATTVCGTVYWMAPEVANSERKGGYNEKCDIWSLGITALELADRQCNLFELDPMQYLHKMTKHGFKPSTLFDKGNWSKDFARFLTAALTKKQDARPSAEKLLKFDFVNYFSLDNQLGKNLIDKASNSANNLSGLDTVLNQMLVTTSDGTQMQCSFS